MYCRISIGFWLFTLSLCWSDRLRFMSDMFLCGYHKCHWMKSPAENLDEYPSTYFRCFFVSSRTTTFIVTSTKSIFYSRMATCFSCFSCSNPLDRYITLWKVSVWLVNMCLTVDSEVKSFVTYWSYYNIIVLMLEFPPLIVCTVWAKDNWNASTANYCSLFSKVHFVKVHLHYATKLLVYYLYNFRF